jgi:hypothetical protein
LSSIAGEIARSVVTTAIIVASCGAIMPEPFAIAEIVTSRPPMSSWRHASFVRVSVVRIASAAGSGTTVSDATKPGTAPITFDAGKRTPIMPVDAVSTCSAVTPGMAFATASRIATTSATPAGPVIAFALPLFTSTARTDALGTLGRASMIGAAAARFCVKTPAATAGTSDTISATSRRTGLRPACAPAKRNPTGTFMDGSSAGRQALLARAARASSSSSARPAQPRPSPDYRSH